MVIHVVSNYESQCVLVCIVHPSKSCPYLVETRSRVSIEIDLCSLISRLSLLLHNNFMYDICPARKKVEGEPGTSLHVMEDKLCRMWTSLYVSAT